MKLAKEIISLLTESMDSDIEKWLKELKSNVEKNTDKPEPHAFMKKTIGWKKGPKFYQVWVQSADRDNDRSAYCFIDHEGNVYKAAGWGKVAKGLRGNISKVETSKFDGSTGWLYAK